MSSLVIESPDIVSGVDGQSLTLVDLLEWRARTQPDRVAYTYLVDGETITNSLTWADLHQRARMIARQLTYFAARQKDSGKRCDLEAGMAKLLAARVAWANADNAVQIHGGNGFALEFPISRILCDARIPSIFEGAAEIQAQVIARRLLSATN